MDLGSVTTGTDWSAIIERAQRLEPDAFDVIVDAYAGRLGGFFRRLLNCGGEAEDLAQEVFVRVVRKIPRYRDDGRFEAWLFRIATNLARDRIRERERRPRIVGLDEAALSGDGELQLARGRSDRSGESGPRRVDDAETQEAIEAAIQRLPQAEREVILLRHYGRLSFDEIAGMMGTPLGTALARAHRGLNKLREWVGDSP